MPEKEYLVTNDSDGNDTFTVKASSIEEALTKALEELGYWVSQGEEPDEQ